jgi:hypothetical protein
MSLRRDQRRALRGIERDLARSDPDLDRLFFSFGALARTQEIPAAEKIRGRQFRCWRGWDRRTVSAAVRTGASGPGRTFKPAARGNAWRVCRVYRNGGAGVRSGG